MTIKEVLSKLKKIDISIQLYVGDENRAIMSFSNLKLFFDKLKIGDNLHLLKALLHILLKVANDYHRTPTFFGKIEIIINYFKDKIKEYFPNWEIFNIFRSNKRILLFLLQEKIIVMDNYIAAQIIQRKYTDRNYHLYFLPEIKPFATQKFLENHGQNDLFDKISKKLPENFDEKRKNGENDNLICEIIRRDSVDEFSSYVKNKKVSLNGRIKDSIFETNSFLLKNMVRSYDRNVSLIEYAAFFGSIKIIKYLLNNDVELTSSIWLYAIHGQNAEVIHLLNDHKIKPKDESYKECFYESIKCHHNDIGNYFLNTFLNDEDEKTQNTAVKCLKYYNFGFARNGLINESLLLELCQYDYYLFIAALLKNKVIDFRNTTIKNAIFYCVQNHI